jgi:hypothetical protein
MNKLRQLIFSSLLNVSSNKHSKPSGWSVHADGFLLADCNDDGRHS